MSLRTYVTVWKGTTPTSIAEAKEIVDRKFKVRGGEGVAELTELASRLWARYPYDVNSVDYDPFWLDARLAGGHDGTQLLDLYPNPSHLGRLLPEIAEEAARLGLAVLDAERRSLFLPSGEVLGKRPAAAHGPTKPEPAPADHVSSEVRARLEPLLSQSGFVRQARQSAEAIFEREFVGGTHQLAWMVGSPSPERMLRIRLSSSFDVILMGMERCAPGFTAKSGGEVIGWPFEGLVLRGGMEFTRLVFPELTSSIIELPNKPGSDAQRLDAIALAMRELALPALARTQDVRAVWRLIEGEATLPFGGRAARWNVRVAVLLGQWLEPAKAEVIAAGELARLSQELVQARAESRNVPMRERRLAEFEKFLADVRQVEAPPGL